MKDILRRDVRGPFYCVWAYAYMFKNYYLFLQINQQEIMMRGMSQEKKDRVPRKNPLSGNYLENSDDNRTYASRLFNCLLCQ